MNKWTLIFLIALLCLSTVQTKAQYSASIATVDSLCLVLDSLLYRGALTEDTTYIPFRGDTLILSAEEWDYLSIQDKVVLMDLECCGLTYWDAMQKYKLYFDNSLHTQLKAIFDRERDKNKIIFRSSATRTQRNSQK